jgi:pilus assembly protein Flp/PilA
MKNLVSRFVKDESGATAIEYGLIAAGIAIAIITAVNGLGSKLSTNFNTISNGAFIVFGPCLNDRGAAEHALRFVEGRPLACPLLQRPSFK